MSLCSYEAIWLCGCVASLKQSFKSFKVSKFQSFQISKFTKYKLEQIEYIGIRISTYFKIWDSHISKQYHFFKNGLDFSCIFWRTSASNKGTKVQTIVEIWQFPQITLISRIAESNTLWHINEPLINRQRRIINAKVQKHRLFFPYGSPIEPQTPLDTKSDSFTYWQAPSTHLGPKTGPIGAL